MIAVCGIDCENCDIYKAATDRALAQKIADAINRRGSNVKPEQIKCGGCRGPRSDHWSADCEILTCCVDQHQLGSCHKCADFVCSRLTDWAGKSERYAQALSRLKDLSE